jgi:hypothetical protein
MPHIIYKTTNMCNGKFYIGKHSFDNEPNPRYLGSGTALLKAVKKYGKDNFIRETLYMFNSETECITKEQEIVTEALTNDPMCYNISTGGRAGRQQHQNTKDQIAKATSSHWQKDPERRNKASIAAKERVLNGKSGVASWTENSRKIMSEKLSLRWKDTNYREKTGQSISKALTGRKLSSEHIKNSRNAQNQLKYCPYCKKSHKLAAYGRWHGDKCKDKK